MSSASRWLPPSSWPCISGAFVRMVARLVRRRLRAEKSNRRAGVVMALPCSASGEGGRWPNRESAGVPEGDDRGDSHGDNRAENGGSAAAGSHGGGRPAGGPPTCPGSALRLRV